MVLLFVTLFLSVVCFTLLWGKYRPAKQDKDHAHELFEFMDCMQDGALVLNQDQELTHINRNAMRFLKLSKDEVQKSFEDKLEGSALITSVKKAVDECQQMTKELHHIPDEPENCFMIECYKVSYGYVVTLKDASSEQQVLDMGKNFVANASHELRTPITIIEGFAETIRDMPQLTEHMLHEMIAKIIRNCHRMNALVKNLLLLADLDHAVQVTKTECDLVALVESCCQTVIEMHPNVLIETLFESDEMPVHINTDMFEQAILNLLQNAIKYSEKRPHITIILKEVDQRVILKISDTGVGMSQKHLAHIFDRFYTVNKDRSRKLGGAGLGLSIVKAIMRCHKADITCDSEIGVGTTFTMTFPMFSAIPKASKKELHASR